MAWSAMDETADTVERLILLAPIEPAPSGNGLAMRTELFRRSAPVGLQVETVVVPVAGRLPGPLSPPPGTVVVPPDPVQAREGVRALLTRPAWRDRFARAGTLPRRARTASPGLVDAVVRAVPVEGSVALHVMRSYLAPLGVAVAEQLDARWATLDIDEDDAAVARARGEVEESAAYERLLDVFCPLFDGLSAASPSEAEAIGRRHGLLVEHAPNAIDLPIRIPRRPEPTRRRKASLLFVGNLTYPPNIEAARMLVEAVLPELQRRLRTPVHVTLVGPHHEQVERLAGPAAEARGFVADLGPVYASATAVVVPLSTGGGTRIKLLEAFAHGVPVVASTVAAAGLAVGDGRHLLLADGATETAAAVERIVTDAALARGLVDEAGRLVRDRYSTDVVIPGVRDLFDRAAARAHLRIQRAVRP